MKIFKLPDLGEGLQEAEIVEWHVAVGDEAVTDQPLLSVETAKAIVEIPSPYSGKIIKLFGQKGELVHLGAPLVGFEGEEDAGTVVGVVPVGQQVLAVPAASPAAHGRIAIGAAAVKALPAARALAYQLKLELAQIAPSGPDGVITVADVQNAAIAPGKVTFATSLAAAKRTP